MIAGDTSYETYAEDENYIAVNREMVGSLDLSGITRVADLACGTGLLSRLLIGRKPELAICGIDLDPVQVGLATKGLSADGVTLHPSLEALRAAAEAGQGGAYLSEASAMELPFADDEIDLVIIGNAIHMMPDRDAFLAEVARVLRPGGTFVFNSVFYTGTFVEGTEAVFTEMMKEAVIAMNEINAARRAAGEKPVPRKRGTVARAFRQTDWLSEEGWCDATRAAGFEIESSGQSAMPITKDGLAAIGGYGGLAEVLMSGYPTDIASQCMQDGVHRAFQNLAIDEVPRNWLQVVATRIE
ncbi:Demethylrebeccamycin-D-glucose O-methyltransferase [Roseivivax sp. THAF40]|uniref:class I SAM-dependent methyltransferase n=1 Tax=unclassified Roseivivax TaxID=2639302 RepID=UPI0012A805BA|nr:MULTISPECIES: class I SAM-dependent methyltransferase [unclassified Roseivivax]QFS84153.1 Demethylrebeccamycin-D-glucose O-methyltransferase [Roseivivax sp. THAF197b]QFT47981.1 Demethylrebeccamycin-D-glucose O-methyltransferase [Roseivivax sp. THAF40]